MSLEEDDFAQVPVDQCTHIWMAFDSYINDLTTANPNAMDEDEWYLKWCKMRPIITDWNTHPQTSLLLITNKPNSTLVDAVKVITTMVPFLNEDVVIKYDKEDENVISFFIKAYSPSTKNQATTPTVTFEFNNNDKNECNKDRGI